MRGFSDLSPQCCGKKGVYNHLSNGYLNLVVSNAHGQY